MGAEDAGAADVPEQPDPLPIQEEEIRQTAPTFPWTVTLRQSITYFQKLPGGGMRVVLAPAMRGPSGSAVPLPPSVEVEFGADGWERFKAQVAADGDQPPQVQIATVLPGGAL